MKPWYAEREFILTVVGSLAALILLFQGQTAEGVALLGISGAGYALSRGIAKTGGGGPPAAAAALLCLLGVSCAAPDVVLDAHLEEAELTEAAFASAIQAVEALDATTADEAARKERWRQSLIFGAEKYTELHAAVQEYLESVGLFGSAEQEAAARADLVDLVKTIRRNDNGGS